MKYTITILLFCCSFMKIHAQDTMQWYESITAHGYSNEAFNIFPIHDLQLHNDKSTTVSFFSFGYSGYIYSKNELFDKFEARNKRWDWYLTLARFSSEGKLMWNIKVTNGIVLGYSKPFSHFHVDSDGNTILAVMFEDIVTIGTDTMRVTKEGNSGIAACIISPEGKVLTSRKLCEGSGRSMDLDAMTFDNSGNIYIAGKFFNHESDWEGSTIHSQESPSYFLASYSLDLKRNWVKPFSTGWDSYGQITNMVYNPVYDKLHILITMDNYTTWSSCKYQSSVLNHQTWNISGERLTSDSLVICDDLMVGAECAVDRYGNVMVIGNFRGKLKGGNISVSSHPSDNPEYCDITNSFLLRCDKVGKVVSITPFIHDAFHNLHSIKTMPNGDYFLAGQINHNKPSKNWIGSPYPNGTRRSFIGKYDYWGNLLSSKEFNKREPSHSDDWDYLHIDVHSDGDMIVADDHMGKYDTIGVSPNPDYEHPSMSMFLLSDKQITPTKYKSKSGWTFGSLSIQNDEMTIYAELPEYRAYRYEVYDVLGKLVVNGNVENGNPMEKFPTTTFASGAYYLRVSNSLTTQTACFVISR